MKIYYLIETGNPASYYCGIGEWCNNTVHAIKFNTKKEALEIALLMGELVGGAPKVIEHMWI